MKKIVEVEKDFCDYCSTLGPIKCQLCGADLCTKHYVQIKLGIVDGPSGFNPWKDVNIVICKYAHFQEDLIRKVKSLSKKHNL